MGVIRNQALILNLPGQPKAIAETLEGLKDSEGGQVIVSGILPVFLIVFNYWMAPYISKLTKKLWLPLDLNQHAVLHLLNTLHRLFFLLLILNVSTFCPNKIK